MLVNFIKQGFLLIDRICYRILLKKCGRNFRAGPGALIKNPRAIEIGSNFFSGPNFYLSTNSNCDIVIGDDVMVGPNVMVLGGNHNIALSGQLMNKLKPRPADNLGIVIESNVWLGAGVIILDGSRIRTGAVIAAGAVVTGEVPENSVYGGVPARFIKFRTHG